MIETRDLTKKYDELTAVKQFNLELERGDVFGFIGPNGSGKTTTMRMIATLLNPTWGEAYVCGYSIYTQAKDIRHVIGYMPDFFGVYDDMKVIEYLEFFASAYRIHGEKRRKVCDEVLELVDLTYKREALVTSLSRGMTQRIGLARVLVHDPQVLLLDEPASGLDPRARIEMRQLLKRLRDMGKTIMVSSHILPELADICNLDTEKLFGVFSENMGAEEYLALAEKTGEAIREGYDGVVVGHGTDTMHHTAAALSFMVQRPPVPIVMVGSQRSSDRPSSDAARNLIHATWTAAHGPIAEVMVCMFGPTSDRYNLLHRGTRVRKMHSSYRSTFRTLGDIPLAMVERDCLTPLKSDALPRRDDREVTVQAAFDERVALLYYYPNMQPDLVDAVIDAGYRGIVFAGTGLGHVNRRIYPALERAREAGVPIYMTLQTLWGFVQMHVYETGREILQLGVVPLANMLPEVAYIKLSWALGLHPGDPQAARELMTRNVAGEVTEREPHDGYLVFQGGVPEVQELMAKLWK